eukprot:789442-Prorocentrum_minimum.AAC.1
MAAGFPGNPSCPSGEPDLPPTGCATGQLTYGHMSSSYDFDLQQKPFPTTSISTRFKRGPAPPACEFHHKERDIT